jgi:tetratricopeptide (TPR) repeat protein
MATIKKKAYAGRRQPEQEIVTLANRFADFVSDNQRAFTISLAAAVVLVLALGGLSVKRSLDERKAAPLFAAAYDVYAMQAGDAPDYVRALGLFRDLQKKYPSTRSGALAQYYVGNSLMDMGRTEEALKEYQAFTGKYSGDELLLGLVYNRLGYLYRGLGKQQEAIRSFEQAEALNGAGVATIELARLYEAGGKEAEAQRKYQEISEKLAGTPLAMEAADKVQKKAAPPAEQAGKNDEKQVK